MQCKPINNVDYDVVFNGCESDVIYIYIYIYKYITKISFIIMVMHTDFFHDITCIYY